MSKFERAKELNEKSARAVSYINKLLMENGHEVDIEDDCDYDFGEDYVINELKSVGITDVSIEGKDFDSLRRADIGAEEFLVEVNSIKSENDIEMLCDLLERKLVGLYFQVLYLENKFKNKDKNNCKDKKH